MKKWVTKLFILVGLALPMVVLAQLQDPNIFQGQLEAGAQGAGLADSAGNGGTDPRILAASLIKAVLGVLGTIFVGLIILAGYRLIKSDGDSGKIQQAYDTLRMSTVGLIIILAAYSITTFVVNKVVTSLKEAGTDQTGFGE